MPDVVPGKPINEPHEEELNLKSLLPIVGELPPNEPLLVMELGITGVTVTDAVTGAFVALVAVNDPILQIPLAARPME